MPPTAAQKPDVPDAQPPAAVTGPPAEGRSPRVAALVLGILLCSTALDLFFFTGLYGSDDANYVAASDAVLSTGHLPSDAKYGADRLGVLGWNILAQLLLGPNVQAIAASYVLAHQILNLLTFALARRLFGTTVGLVAAYGTATLPVLIIFSTFITPDLLLACFFVLAYYAFLRGMESRNDGNDRSARLWLAGAGVAVGLGYLTKSSALILLPFFFVYWLISERAGRRRGAIARGACFAAGLFGVVLIEFAVLAYLHGEPGVRLQWATEQPSELTRQKVASYGSTPLERLQWVDRRFSSHYVPRGFKPVVLAAMALFPLMYRRRLGIWLLALWSFAYLTWGTMRLTEYLPPSIQTRYYVPVVVLAVVVAAAVAVKLFEWTLRATRRVGLHRAVRVGGLVLLLAYPLTGLGGPNGLAGKSYYAWCVHGASRAIRHAASTDEWPIAASPLLSSRVLNPMFGSADHPRIRTYPALRDPQVLQELLECGRWHFLLIEPRYLRPDSTDALDRAMQTLVRIEEETVYLDDPLAGFEPIWSLDPVVSDSVRLGGYRLFAQQIKRFAVPPTRVEAVAQALSIVGDDCLASPRRSDWTVTLVDVATEPEADSLPNGQRRSLALRADQWQVWAAPDATLGPCEPDGLRLEWEEVPKGYLWFLPRPDTPPDSLQLRPEERGELLVDVALGEGVTAEMVVKGVVAGVGDIKASRLHLALSDGENALVLPPSRASRSVTPMFRVIGSGSFELRRLDFRTAKCDGYRDLMDVLAESASTRPADPASVAVPPGLSTSQASTQRAECRLDPNGVFKVVVIGFGEGRRRAELLLQAYGDEPRQDLLVEKRFVLKEGLNSVAMRTGASGARLRLTIGTNERGAFLVRECNVARLTPASR